MKRLMFALAMLAMACLFVRPVDALVYQEHANYYNCTGDWRVNGTGGEWDLNCSQGIADGNWDSNGAFGGLDSGEYMANYTKPSNTTALTATWKNRLTDVGYFNISIPNDCLNKEILQLKVNGSNSILDHDVDYFCKNATGWKHLYNWWNDFAVYDEAIFWSDYPALINCSLGGTPTVRFNNLRETNQTSINATLDISFNISNELYGANNSYSFSFSENATHQICINPNWTSYNIDAQLQFDGSGYSPRSYYLTNATLTNTTQNVNLYLLEDSSSAGVVVYVKDSSDNYVAGAKVILEKYYIGSGTYETVVIGETDGSGKFYTYLDLNDVYYRAYVYDTDGTLSNEYSPMTIPDTVNDPEELIFYLSSAPPEYFDFEGSAAYYCTFTNATKIIRCVITDGSGLMSQACLDVDKQGLLSYTNICDTCGTGSSVTLTCNITNYANGTVMYKFSAVMSSGNQKLLVTDYIYFPGAPKFGDIGLIATIIMILGMALVGIFSPLLAMFLAICGLAIGAGLGMVEVSVTSLIGLLILVIIIGMGRRNS